MIYCTYMNTKLIEWVLRIGIAGEFFGHGVFALQQKQGWIKYFEAVGISSDTALTLMLFIGVMDVTLALLVLIYPMRLPLLWMTFWGFLTALIRPIGGDPIWDFVERSANWAAPLTLLLMFGWPQTFKEWWS